MPDDVATPNRVVEKWVFAGMRISTKDKPLYHYRVVDRLDRVWNLSKALGPQTVGTVFQVTVEDDKSYFLPGGALGPRYVGRYEDQSQVETWAVESETVEQHFNTKRINAKAKTVKPLKKLMGQVSDIASTLNSSERRAFVSMLSEAVYEWRDYK